MPIPSGEKQQPNPNTAKDRLKMSIKPSLAKKIERLADERETKTVDLVNEILKEYLFNLQAPPKESGTDFLLSIAGMFDSGKNDTSENVRSIVTNSIKKKYGKTEDDESAY